MSEERYWDPAFQLMLEEARRSIDRQSERVQTVRERAVSLVGFGAVVAAALGLPDAPRNHPAVIVALVAFVFVASAALYILKPRPFQYELGARRIEDWMYRPGQKGVQQMIRSAALAHDENHAANYRTLEKMQTAISLGVAALFVETVALAALLVL